MPLSAAAAAAADSVNRTMPDCFADRSRNNPEEMQRCPYLHEMKERLLSQPTPTDSLDMERLDGTPVKEPNLHNDYPAHTNPGVIPDPPEMPPDSLIGTVVKVHEFRGLPSTSPARHSSFHFRETYFHFLLDRVVVPNKTRSINRVRSIDPLHHVQTLVSRASRYERCLWRNVELDLSLSCYDLAKEKGTDRGV